MLHQIRKRLARNKHHGKFAGTDNAASSNESAKSIPPSENLLPNPIGKKPAKYGKFWKEHTGGLEWYKWMYKSRLEQHRAFQEWFNFINHLEPVSSVLELGCGLAVGYADFFEGFRYIGVDISAKEIAWCKTNRAKPNHDYIACDFIDYDFADTFDVVFSQGTIDNTYNMDSFLQAAVSASRRWIYITAYRGFFPYLAFHKYSWNDDHGCYYNDISPKKVVQFLDACGCTNISVIPTYTGRENVEFETLIIARVSDNEDSPR